jgi:hypothetical protein
MIQAKSWDILGEFHTTHFTKYSEWWFDHWAPCVKTKEDDSEGTTSIKM